MEASEALKVFIPDDDHSHGYCRKEDGLSFVNYGSGCQVNNTRFRMLWGATVSESPKVPSFAPKDDELSIQPSLAFDQGKGTCNGQKPELILRRR